MHHLSLQRLAELEWKVLKKWQREQNPQILLEDLRGMVAEVPSTASEGSRHSFIESSIVVQSQGLLYTK